MLRHQPFDSIFLVGFIVYVATRGVYQKRTKNVQRIVNRADAFELALFVIVTVGCMLLPVLYLFTPLFAFADYELPKYVMWDGTVVMVLALWLFWRSHADLGLNWSKTLEIRQGHQLVTTGVYRFIRHPMYASIFLFGLAQGLMLQNWLAGWAALLSFALMYFIRLPREEQMMVEQFGDEYRNYMRRTGRLIPRFVCN